MVTLTPIKMLGTLNPCLHTSWHTGLRPLVSCTDLETAIWRHPAERLQGGDRSLCSSQQKHTPKEKLISLEYTPDSNSPLENDGVSRNEYHTAKTEWQMMRKWRPKPSKTSQSSFGQTPTQRRIALLTGFKARLVFRVAFLYNLSLHKDRRWNKLGHGGTNISPLVLCLWIESILATGSLCVFCTALLRKNKENPHLHRSKSLCGRACWESSH